MKDDIFSDRTALVTGGARGIGRSICEMLAGHGARVAVNYERNEQAAHETLASIENSAADAMIVQADVSDEEQVARMTEAVRERLGPIDLLVNNAGIASSTPHDELPFATWKRMFEVNVDGPYLTTWAVKDEMIAREYGRIVNISSLAGIKIKGRMISYATTKSALISFTRHCAEAFAPHNIRVNCVAPGLTNTELARSANPDMVEHLISITPMGRIGEPEEIASVVKFLLSDDSSFVTGQTVPACGGRC
ncbi:MAG: beta-ketoacyl-ACP reductase [Planctomycetaceae bacterium]|nr:beta-ketoacyl-ACP reductase [Planctomycetaceae bacterium]